MDPRVHKEKLFLCFALLFGGLALLLQVGLTASARNTALQLEEDLVFQSRLPFESMFEGFVDRQHVSDLLIQAIITVESRGDANAVGTKGERGLMQIMPETWRETTVKMFGEALPFDQAFDPVMNQRVGRAYLNRLQRYLSRNRQEWGASERFLILACYNAGPQKVRSAGFELTTLPQQTQSYIQKVTVIHDDLMEKFARPAERHMVLQPDPPVMTGS